MNNIYNFNNIIKLVSNKNNRENLQALCFSPDGFMTGTNNFSLVRIKAVDINISVVFDENNKNNIIISSKYLKGKNIKEISLKDDQTALLLLDDDTVLQVPANAPDTFPNTSGLFNPDPEVMQLETNFTVNPALMTSLLNCYIAPVVIEPWRDMLAVYDEKNNDIIGLLMYIKR
jgi:hypothetical protein